MDIDFLVEDITNNPTIMNGLNNTLYAQALYGMLCNIRWIKKYTYITDEDEVVGVLRGDKVRKASCSWRFAGGVIASIRASIGFSNENYMTYYCCGTEGCIDDGIQKELNKMGWEVDPDY